MTKNEILARNAALDAAHLAQYGYVPAYSLRPNLIDAWDGSAILIDGWRDMPAAKEIGIWISRTQRLPAIPKPTDCPTINVWTDATGRPSMYYLTLCYRGNYTHYEVPLHVAREIMVSRYL